jgi:hypothetical protein
MPSTRHAPNWRIKEFCNRVRAWKPAGSWPAINLGIQSISKLDLKQREQLIDMLIEMGAVVRNPRIYQSDLKAAGSRRLGFSAAKEHQLRVVDALADKVTWHEQDGYLRFCHRTIKAPRPRNSREVTTFKLALQSLINQQSSHNSETLV